MCASLSLARARVCVMQGGAEPDPCVFYLHLNEARELIYPSAAVRRSLFMSLAVSLSLSLSASQTDIDLLARQGDPPCCSAFAKSLLSLSFVPGKGLDPTHCCHIAALCTPAPLPPYQGQSAHSRHVCPSGSVRVRESQPMCVLECSSVCGVFIKHRLSFTGSWVWLCADWFIWGCKGTFSCESLVCPCWAFVCAASSSIAEWVRVHLASGWIRLQGNEWPSLLEKDVLCCSFASISFYRKAAKGFSERSFFFPVCTLTWVHILFTLTNIAVWWIKSRHLWTLYS